MEEQDLSPQRQKPKPKDLDVLSIGQLEEYIAELEAEIARARAAIAAKSSHRSVAETFFKR